ncbi:hypothetical protein V5799_030768 [Amblyomma americanum]|uniref:ABC transporter domain-containing protein n=1 Tax=Amblyomma americanum TaxID=6943 RepID=A0AAQ4EN47_AMBAM
MPAAHTAVAGAMLYWTFSCVMPFLTLEHAGGQGYHYIQRKHKLWTSIFPGMSLHWSFRVLERFEKFVENGANWTNFYDRAATPDNVTLAEIVLVGIVTDCVIVTILWYVENVLPIGPGIAKSFLFPFKLKGIPLHKVRYELVTLVHDVNLSDYRHVRAVDLSLGLQRRLCAALAILGKPKVIIMDEPTSNMDPDGRREMWELLLKIRRSCAVFLTTQHLDEADVLGDRILIMANGRIRCGGSPTFLKQRFGTGYHMQINKLPKCNIAGIELLLKKYAPKAKRQTDSDNEAVFILGQIVATRKIVTMFKAIEKQSENLGIESVGLTVTSLEDVLVRVGEDHHIHRHHKLEEDHSGEASLVDTQGIYKGY